MKVLVTGGCSFSDQHNPNTWPYRLSTRLPEYQHTATGLGAQGNGLISRRIIYKVSELLKTTNPADILVGVMWSGPERHDFFNEDIKFDDKQKLTSRWVENPTGFVDSTDKNWIIVSPGWPTKLAQNYYVNFHSHVGSVIYTYEHVLRTQWFLKMHSIKYFMSAYTSEVLQNWHVDHNEVQYLKNQIDLDHFLPVDGEWDWCKYNSGIPFASNDDSHPSKEQHQAFTDQVIIPFLQNKGYI